MGGKIPESLGQLRSINYIILAENNFSGTLRSIFNISSLEFQSSETEKSSCWLKQPYRFYPTLISIASNLEILNLSENRFTGKLGIDFNSLINLARLNLGKKNLGIGTTSDLDFITLLRNCSKLKTLRLQIDLEGCCRLLHANSQQQ